MLEEAEARRQILDRVQPGSVQDLFLHDCLGRFLARDFRAAIDLPGFDNSQMDGYAVRAQDSGSGAILRVTGAQPAGPDLGLMVSAGEAVRIFTGAPLPRGADAVVMQEDTEINPADPTAVRILESARRGEFIRRKGSDLCIGQKILRQGEAVTPERIGLAASQGWAALPVYEQPSVAIVATGDELASPGVPLAPGQIYNSNGPMLKALAEKFGGQVVSSLHGPDDPVKLRETLERALDAARFCIIAGGVSVGEHDHVKEVLSGLGMEAGFWRVRIKPGKPLLFGFLGDRLVFGLPGNPVSAHVTFHLFVLPVLLKAAGAAFSPDAIPLAATTAVLASEVSNPGDRPHYLRMSLDFRSGSARPAGLQESHALFALSSANALLRLEGGQMAREGDLVKCWLI